MSLSQLNSTTNTTTSLWAGTYEPVSPFETVRICVLAGSGTVEVNFSTSTDDSGITHRENLRVVSAPTVLHVSIVSKYMKVRFIPISSQTISVSTYLCTGLSLPLNDVPNRGWDTSGGTTVLHNGVISADDRTSTFDRGYTEVAVYGQCSSSTTLTVQCTPDMNSYYATNMTSVVGGNQQFYLDLSKMAPRYLSIMTSNDTSMVAYLARK